MEQGLESRKEIAGFIGNALLALREEKKISQVEVAKRLGKTKSWVSEVERGIYLPSISTIKDFCNAMDEDPILFALDCLIKVDWQECHKQKIKEMILSN